MEEVIIDGVNVAGCDEYSKYREGYCGWYVPCDVEGACSYKIDWLRRQHNYDVEEIAKLGLDVSILEKERDELKKHIEMLVDAINQGTKKFQYEEAPFLHEAMGKHFEFETGLSLDEILGE